MAKGELLSKAYNVAKSKIGFLSPEERVARMKPKDVTNLHNGLNAALATDTITEEEFRTTVGVIDKLEAQYGPEIQDEYDGVKDRKKRRLLKDGVIITAGFVIGTVGYFNIFSPEAQQRTAANNAAQKEKAERQEEEGRKQIEQFVKSDTLGVHKTSISKTNWTARYLTMEESENSMFVEDEDIANKTFMVKSGNDIQYRASTGRYPTYDYTEIGLTNNMILNKDRDNQKVIPVPRLTVHLPTGDEENWFLRTEPDPENKINTRVLVLENEANGLIRYLDIKLTKSDTPDFEVRIMKRVSHSEDK